MHYSQYLSLFFHILADFSKRPFEQTRAGDKSKVNACLVKGCLFYIFTLGLREVLRGSRTQGSSQIRTTDLGRQLEIGTFWC